MRYGRDQREKIWEVGIYIDTGSISAYDGEWGQCLMCGEDNCKGKGVGVQ
jgi:hypothetical protein